MTHQQPKKVFLVINKFAGHREKVKKEVDTVVSCLQKNGCEVNYAYTQFPGHATKLAIDAIKNGFGLIVAVGGDGTVNEVAQGLIGTSAIMGIVPAGSGNGLARELGISMNARKSARALLKGSIKQIDVCRLNNQRFLCTCGIGFDARIADLMNKSSHRKIMRYIQLTVRESIRFKPFQIKMIIGDVLLQNSVFMVTFANASQFGNNATIAPGASITDGLIDVIVVHPFKKIWLPVFGIGLFTRMIPKLPFIDHYRTKQIELVSADTLIFHFDGEPGKLNLPANISVDKEKIFVVTGKTT